MRTDNGQPILDVHGLRITDPLAMETEVNQWPGVVTVGIFARHKASLCLLGTPQGVRDAALLIGRAHAPRARETCGIDRVEQTRCPPAAACR